MISQIILRAYSLGNSRYKAFLRGLITKLEGGEMKSQTLRKIFRNYHDIEVGLYSYGCFEINNIPAGTSIGRYCSFARNTILISGNHALKFKSLHPYFYNPALGYVEDLKIVRTKFNIQSDVWIGVNAIVLPSVQNIGIGAVIGAGSIVTRDVPNFAIVAGNPARIIRYRFSSKNIDNILAEKWWEQDIDYLKNNPKIFSQYINPVE